MCQSENHAMKKFNFNPSETDQMRFERIWASLEGVSHKVKGIGDSQGEDAEEFFLNTLQADKNIGGLQFDAVHSQVKGGMPGQQQEYDIILENRGSVAVIEVKYKFRKSDLDQLEQQLKRLKKDFPSYRRKHVYGGIAGFSIRTEVADLARSKGYFVLRRKGQLLRVEAGDMKKTSH
jgi:predicted AAA+ superfamily ATPase